MTVPKYRNVTGGEGSSNTLAPSVMGAASITTATLLSPPSFTPGVPVSATSEDGIDRSVAVVGPVSVESFLDAASRITFQCVQGLVGASLYFASFIPHRLWVRRKRAFSPPWSSSHFLIGFVRCGPFMPLKNRSLARNRREVGHSAAAILSSLVLGHLPKNWRLVTYRSVAGRRREVI